MPPVSFCQLNASNFAAVLSVRKLSTAAVTEINVYGGENT